MKATFTVEPIEGVDESGDHCVRKVVRGDRCYFDKLCRQLETSGLHREVMQIIALLEELGFGRAVPPNKFRWLRDDPRSGKCEHPGEFEIRVKQVRCYGLLQDGTLYLMFGGHIKHSRGTRKKSSTDQEEHIKRFRTLVREWLKQ